MGSACPCSSSRELLRPEFLFGVFLTSVFSAIVSQLVYTLGGSGFAGANGSMMIEVVVSL